MIWGMLDHPATYSDSTNKIHSERQDMNMILVLAWNTIPDAASCSRSSWEGSSTNWHWKSKAYNFVRLPLNDESTYASSLGIRCMFIFYTAEAATAVYEADLDQVSVTHIENRVKVETYIELRFDNELKGSAVNSPLLRQLCPSCHSNLRLEFPREQALLRWVTAPSFIPCLFRYWTPKLSPREKMRWVQAECGHRRGRQYSGLTRA